MSSRIRSSHLVTTFPLSDDLYLARRLTATTPNTHNLWCKVTAKWKIMIQVIVTMFAVFAVGCSQSKQDDAPLDVPLDAVLQSAVHNGDVAGVVAMAATADEVIYQGAFGKRERDVEMTLDSIFRIASMTKAVTSVAAMQLVEEGAIQLDEPVSTYIPDFAPRVLESIEDGEPVFREPTSAVTVRHLLTHTAGFGYEMWNPLLREAATEGIIPSLYSGGDDFLAAPLVFDPGSQWHYGISTDWLGRVVEEVRGASLDDVFREHIFEPLGMNDTHFNLPREKAPRLVAVHRRVDGRLAEQERQTPGVRTFFSGGVGLVSTATDYIRFVQMFLNRGSVAGSRILKPETVNLMAENHIGQLQAGAMKTVMPEVSNDFDFFPTSSDRFGLGFLLNSDPVPGGRSAGSLAWAGIYNSYFWIDLERGTAGVLMAQNRPFFDGPVIELLERFEQSVYDSLANEY